MRSFGQQPRKQPGEQSTGKNVEQAGEQSARNPGEEPAEPFTEENGKRIADQIATNLTLQAQMEAAKQEREARRRAAQDAHLRRHPTKSKPINTTKAKGGKRKPKVCLFCLLCLLSLIRGADMYCSLDGPIARGCATGPLDDIAGRRYYHVEGTGDHSFEHGIHGGPATVVWP